MRLRTTATNATTTTLFSTFSSSTEARATRHRFGSATIGSLITTATSTGSNGFDITDGCYAINGVCLSSDPGGGGGSGVLIGIQTFTIHDTYVPSAGATAAQVVVTGGGGGGGGILGTDTTNETIAGGGGAGGTAIAYIDVTATTSVQVFVGSGGSAGANTGGDGGTGGTSAFSTSRLPSATVVAIGNKRDGLRRSRCDRRSGIRCGSARGEIKHRGSAFPRCVCRKVLTAVPVDQLLGSEVVQASRTRMVTQRPAQMRSRTARVVEVPSKKILLVAHLAAPVQRVSLSPAMNRPFNGIMNTANGEPDSAPVHRHTDSRLSATEPAGMHSLQLRRLATQHRPTH